MMNTTKYNGAGGKGTYVITQRYMKGLKESKLKMYKPYSASEQNIYKPTRL